MPTYEYECLKCGHAFEAFQRMTDEPLKRCPSCRGKVRRAISGGAGFLFKGSGFYATDYRSEGYRSAAKADRAPAAAGDGKKDAPAAGKSEAAKPSAAAPKPPAGGKDRA